eukprot:Rhum_TRINITY_DN14924_c3_g1::Rhum_TRINITY_DN14924_c3_g1_i1::g.129027::m.129027/K07890/RAB21; Ras-related protein Rab-21
MGDKFKIVLLGEGRVGKTSLVRRYVLDEFSDKQQSTVQANMYSSKKLNIDDRVVNISIWDTAGQERFRALGPIYYRDSHGALLVYDITDADTFEKVKAWVRELRKMVGEDIRICVAGNKADLSSKRQVEESMVLQYCKDLDAHHIYTSAKTGKGVHDCFLTLTKSILARQGAKGGGGGGGGGGESRDADATTQEEPQRKYEAVAEEPPQPPPTADTAGEAADAAAGAPVAEAEGEMSPAAPAGKAAVRERLGLESASVFDTAFAMEQVDGDIDFAVEMAESMVVQYDDVSASVPEAIRAQEWAAVFEKAHALKGAVATLGVNRVRMVAHALEQAGRVFNDAAAGNGDPARSAYSVPELDVLLEILAEEWDQYLKVFKQETDALRSANQ